MRPIKEEDPEMGHRSREGGRAGKRCLEAKGPEIFRRGMITGVRCWRGVHQGKDRIVPIQLIVLGDGLRARAASCKGREVSGEKTDPENLGASF